MEERSGCRNWEAPWDNNFEKESGGRIEEDEEEEKEQKKYEAKQKKTKKQQHKDKKADWRLE